MATYDLTSKSTAFVKADSTANRPSNFHSNPVVVLQEYLDIAELIANGYTMAAGDVFNLLEVKAGQVVLMAGAEVVTAFDGTTPTVDIDFAAGDDMIDGGDVSSTGFLAAGTNGTDPDGIVATASKNYADYVGTTDTIDVVLNAGASDVTTGVLRVYAVVVDLKDAAPARASSVDRDVA